VNPWRVALIGVGDMGAPMAKRLLGAGYEVAAYDVDRERVKKAGAVAMKSPAAATEDVSSAVVMVRTLDQVESVLFAPKTGIAAAKRHDLDVAVMSTVDPASMARLAEKARFSIVDAPVSGGVKGAETGTLTIMASGPADAIERLKPLFQVFGGNLFVVGDRPGMAQAVKLANQLMLAASVMGTLEGLSVARASGLTPEQVLPVIEPSTGASWVSKNFDIVRDYWERDDPMTGALGIILKDLASIDREAAARELDVPAARLALEKLRDAWERSGLEHPAKAGFRGD
jgi:3-hydroxyisobutyrate dehydrogenase